MKTYNQFQEAISPTRLAQLKAKGKGEAAARQMKADGTSPGPHQGNQEKARRVAQGNTPQNKGGALVKSSPNNSALKGVAKDLAVRGAKAAANKGMEMLKNKMAEKSSSRSEPKRPPGVGGMVDRTTKRTGSPNSALTKYKEPAPPSFKDSVTKGAKSAMGGDAFAKDDSARRRKAREELGKKGVEAAKGVGKAALKALSHGQGGGERFSGSASGTATNLKRGGGRGGD